jgi:drug/metabolite transporter (DMT)-like permease
VVNRMRLLMAFAFLVITNLAITGQIMPFDAGNQRWLWLGLSGIIGFVLGDGMLFQAFVMLGTRITMLIMSLVPVISAIFAWIFLGENLTPIEILAILITVGGIIWVVADNHQSETKTSGKQLAVGLALALGGATGQAIGLIFSKKGLAGDFPALSGNLIRVTIAMIIIWLAAFITGKTKSTFAKLADKKALYAVIIGSTFGPFIGVWMSLVAIKYTKIGIASTIMALPPVLLLPLTPYFFKEKVTVQAILGTIVAVGGVALLFLS